MDELLNTLASLDIQLRSENGKLKCNAPVGAITPYIRDRIAAHKDELLAYMVQQQTTGAGAHDAPIPVCKRDGLVPLSFSQRRLLVLEELAGVGAAYILPAVLRMKGDLREDKLKGALREIIVRHEVLRTILTLDDGAFHGEVLEATEIPFGFFDLQMLADEHKEQEITKIIDHAVKTPFDLSSEIPLRTALIKIAQCDFIFIVAFHHSVADGWSIGIFQRELAAAYNGLIHGTHNPEPLNIQYADYAVWQNTRFSGEYREEKRTYWKKVLAGASHTLNLPVDKPRSRLQTFNGSSVHFQIDSDTVTGLKELTAKTEGTLFMTLLAGYGVFLARSCSQEDILVGIPMHNRLKQELEQLIGYFSDTVPIRLQLEGNPTILELLRRIRTASVGAYENQDIPFDDLVNIIKPDRDLSRNPLVQVMFALQNAPLHGPQPELKLDGIEVEAMEVDQQFIRLDLEMHLWETDIGLKGMLFYNTDLFSRETAEKMCGRYRNILTMMAVDPEQRISGLPWLDETERHLITTTWNANARPYSDTATIHEQFHSLAVTAPEKTAIISGKVRLSRGELDAISDRIAAWLIEAGVRSGDKVAIYTERSWCSIASMLAILKAEGVYVPIDSTYPPSRRDLMIEDAGVRCILTESSLLDSVKQWWHGPFLSVDSNELPETLVPLTKGDPDALCYIIYTSGSTGTPKGVRIRHRGVINMVEAICSQLKPSGDDVWTVFHSHSFDLSVWEIWGCLLSGGTLVVVDHATARDPEAFYELAVKEGVTLLSQTPTALEQFASCHEQARQPAPIKYIGCGGESFPSSLAARILKWNIPVWNFYGPTEATVWASVHRVTANDLQQATVPIGRPFANMSMYILDEYGNPLPPNSPGELCIGGVGVACGYHNRADLTAEKFTENPFDSNRDNRLYHTGDLARYAHDGSITILGRMDRQTKLRGFRIEPGEIEHAFCDVQAINQAVAVVREDDGVRKLVVYIVAAESAPTDEALKMKLRDKLPEYMIPQVIVRLKELPVSHNGKVDTAALPIPHQIPSVREYKAPEGKEEKLLANVWSEVLGVDRVGVDDNLFDIGVNSLLVVQVQRTLRKTLCKELTVTDFFRFPTISSLASYLSGFEDKSEGADPAQMRSVARREAMRRQKQTSRKTRRPNV